MVLLLLRAEARSPEWGIKADVAYLELKMVNNNLRWRMIYGDFSLPVRQSVL